MKISRTISILILQYELMNHEGFKQITRKMRMVLLKIKLVRRGESRPLCEIRSLFDHGYFRNVFGCISGDIGYSCLSCIGFVYHTGGNNVGLHCIRCGFCNFSV